MITQTTATAAGPDPDDPGPVWSVRAGEALVPGIRAWTRIDAGLRCEAWLAWSDDRCHPVLVKLARPDQTDRARPGLQRELTALALLDHPNVPRVYTSDLDAVVPYLVEEYVDGRSLADLLGRRRLGTDACLTLAVQLLGVLVSLHARGLAHLDLKPDNVMVRDGRPVLVDFGSTRRIGALQPAGQPVGTAGFVAPELEACAPVSAAMDVYGVGVVLRAARRGPATPGRRRLTTLVDRLTAADPADRPTAREALALAGTALPERRRPWPTWVPGS